jgi:glycosyltransferase involved in cell wall biosynthesis
MLKAWNELGADVDMVYERFTCMQAVGRIFQKKGVPWILECNALFYDEATSESKTVQLKEVAKYLERKAYQQCDLLVCISGILKQALIDKMGVEKEKIVVVPNGVNLTRFAGEVERRYPKNEFVVGFTGLLTKWNRLSLLLQAVARLKQEGLVISLVFVGDGDGKAAIETEVKELGISDRVRFEGRVSPSDVATYIKSFDLGYCNPLHASTSSDFSGCPMKIFEYMAAGCNLLVSRLEIIQSIGIDDDIAFIFEGGDLTSLTNTLRYAYNERSSFARRSAALEEVSSHHSWKSRVEDVLEAVFERGIIARG